MKKFLNIKIISVFLITIGIVLLITGKLLGGESGVYISFANGGLKTFSEKEHQQESFLLDEFSELKVKLKYNNFEIIRGSEYRLEIDSWSNLGKVEYYFDENKRLIIKQDNLFSFSYVSIGFDFSVIEEYNVSKVKLYIPYDEQLEDIDIILDDGTFTCDDLELNKLWITSKYSDVNLPNIISNDIRLILKDSNCTIDTIKTDDFYYENHYGDLNAENIEANKAELTVDTGKLIIDIIKAGTVDIFNKYGKVELTDGFVTDSTDIKADSSDISVNGKFLGNTSISIKYGDLKLKTNESEENYSYEIKCKYGKAYVNGVREDDIKRISDVGNNLNIDVDSGDVHIDFN